MNILPVGCKIVLGEHQNLGANNGGKDWNDEMHQYVGKIATITEHIIYGWYKDERVKHCYRVDIDGGRWVWRATDCKPAIEHPNQKCSGCNTAMPHIDKADNITCDFCKVSNDLR